MARLPWHKRDNEEMLDLMRRLDLEEFAILSGFIDLFCSRGGDVPDDDRFIAGSFSKDVRLWKRVKVKLIARELLEARADGRLYCPIAERVWHDGLRRYMDAARAGRASGQKRAQTGTKSGEISRSSRLPLENETESYADKSNGKSRHSSELDETPVQRPFERYRDTKDKEPDAPRTRRAVQASDALPPHLRPRGQR